eukprot:959364_1
MQRIQLLQSQLDEWQTCLAALQSNHLTNYLRFELMELRNKIEILQSYQQQLQFDNEILKYDINTLRKDISSTSVHILQPRYNSVQRITNQTQLKVLSAHASDSTVDLIGQIVKKKDLSTMVFIELLLSTSYMIKIAFTKDAFTKETYNEMRSNCKLGAIIECNGQLEDEKAQTKVLIVNKIQLISLFNRRHGDDRGFKPYSEPNKRKSKQILCSHFIKYFVTHHKDTKRIPLNTTFIPPICVQSQCIFRHVLLSKKELNCIMEQRELRDKVLDEECDANDPFDDTKQGKVARARFFGDWIVEKYGLDQLRKNGVLDVAGGGGDLANVLSQYDIAVTIVDPRVPDKLNKIMRKKIKKLRKKNVENNVVIPRHINAWFDWDTLDTNDDIKKVFSACEVVLGLHPDEATEAIVDLSLKYGKKFAIVPCCVFPNLFPKYLRMDDDDVEKEVVTYLQFIEYLKRKHQCIKIDYLRFKGRNKVLYFDGK